MRITTSIAVTLTRPSSWKACPRLVLPTLRLVHRASFGADDLLFATFML